MVMKLGVHTVGQPKGRVAGQRNRRRTSSERAGRPSIYPKLTLQPAHIQAFKFQRSTAGRDEVTRRKEVAAIKRWFGGAKLATGGSAWDKRKDTMAIVDWMMEEIYAAASYEPELGSG